MRLQEGFITYEAGEESALRTTRIQTCPHFYLCHYLPHQKGKDGLSYSLLRFKRGAYPDRGLWIACMLDALQECKGYLNADTLILRAFRHWETGPVLNRPQYLARLPSFQPQPLDLLGLEIARKFGCLYAPDWIGKIRPTRHLIRLEHRDIRDEELSGVYFWKGPPTATAAPTPLAEGSTDMKASLVVGPTVAGRTFRYVWIIDDVLTTGSTIAAILQTVMPRLGPAQVFALTMCKTSVDTTINHSVRLSSDMGSWKDACGWQFPD